jgi:4'-phosphopantetheinyl transferase
LVESLLGADEVRVYTLDTGDGEIVRAHTRAILGDLIRVAPEDIAFDIGPQGKPTLRNDPALYFSVSHSEAVSMIAVTRVADIGVDVERCRAVPRAETIMRRFFASDKVESILADDQMIVRFAQAWTEAESTVKVRGASVWEAATPDPRVEVRTLVAPDGYAASVAVASRGWTVVQVAR